MSDINLTRYNPRQDTEELLKLIKEFEYRTGEIDLNQVEKELKSRSNNLKLRNSIILAREDDKLIGAGFVSIWNDFLGEEQVIVHDVVIRKEDAFKKGIEEQIFKEIIKYLKNFLKVKKYSMFVEKKGQTNLKSIIMNFGVKPSLKDYYENIF